MKQRQADSDRDFLTTGQAAKICSVTPDTVLKWVRSGRLPARRTPGGHNRIRRQDLERIMGAQTGSELEATMPEPVITEGEPLDRSFRYCWEFNGKGSLLDGCKECVVYQMRAHRCYEVVKLTTESAHQRSFCQESCADCDYYRQVHQQATNVLVVTDNHGLTGTLSNEPPGAPFSLEVVSCEYTCSALVESFRPDYVVVDCSLGPERSRDICHHITEDPRIPYARVIMAADQEEYPAACDKEVFARIAKPFRAEDIAACIQGVSREKDEGPA